MALKGTKVFKGDKGEQGPAGKDATSNVYVTEGYSNDLETFPFNDSLFALIIIQEEQIENSALTVHYVSNDSSPAFGENTLENFLRFEGISLTEISVHYFPNATMILFKPEYYVFFTIYDKYRLVTITK